jgi:hypothetical protein
MIRRAPEVISGREETRRRRRGITRRPRGIISLPDGIISLPEGIISLPEGIISLPEGIISATIRAEIVKLWTPRGKETTSPSPPRSKSARPRPSCFKLWTQIGCIAALRERIRSQIRRVEESGVPRGLPRSRVMTPPGRRASPSRRGRSRSGTRATEIGRLAPRGEQPRPTPPPFAHQDLHDPNSRFRFKS